MAAEDRRMDLAAALDELVGGAGLLLGDDAVCAGPYVPAGEVARRRLFLQAVLRVPDDGLAPGVGESELCPLDQVGQLGGQPAVVLGVHQHAEPAVEGHLVVGQPVGHLLGIGVRHAGKPHVTPWRRIIRQQLRILVVSPRPRWTGGTRRWGWDRTI